MVDINTYFKSLKVSWVKRLLSSKTSNWKVIPRKYFDKFGKNWLIFKMNMDNGKSIENFNDIQFYVFISPYILVSYLSKISWCFCLSTSKFYPTVYYFFLELCDIINFFYWFTIVYIHKRCVERETGWNQKINFNRGLWKGGVEYGWYKQLF
jgi:hypothetical protein